MFSDKNSKQKSEDLRKILDKKGIISMPGCFDALSAKLIEREGIEVGFMSGFSVSSTKLGMPDTGLISFAEMLEQVKNISNAIQTYSINKKLYIFFRWHISMKTEVTKEMEILRIGLKGQDKSTFNIGTHRVNQN